MFQDTHTRCACGSQGLWAFSEFSESRFIGMGYCCRTVLASVLLGLEDLVQFVKDQKSESNYVVCGFSRFSPEVKNMMALVSLTSYLPETVLGLMLHDDRLAVIYPEVKMRSRRSWLLFMAFLLVS